MQVSINKALIASRDFYHYVNVDDILYCRFKQASTSLFIHNYGQINVSLSLSEVQQKLNTKEFVQPHENYLVNPKYILSISHKKHSEVYLKGGATIPVSAKLKEVFINKLQASLRIHIP